jgi:hypothetical protein
MDDTPHLVREQAGGKQGLKGEGRALQLKSKEVENEGWKAERARSPRAFDAAMRGLDS